MYKRCTTERAAEQQHRFEDCLLNCMKKTAYTKISVSHLCEKTGLSRKTFYRLFDCKDDVLYALIDQTLRNCTTFHTAEEDPSTLDRLGELRQLFSYWYEQKAVLNALHNNSLSTVLIFRAMEYALNEDSSWLTILGAANSPNSREILLFSMSGMTSLVIDWCASGYQKSVPEMANLFWELISTPMIHLTD